MEHLDLSNSQILVDISKVLTFKAPIKSLNLNNCKTSNENDLNLVKLLRSNNTLHYLNLSNTLINADTLSSLGDSLKYNNTLEVLELNNIDLNKNFLTYLAAVLQRNISLYKIENNGLQQSFLPNIFNSEDAILINKISIQLQFNKDLNDQLCTVYGPKYISNFPPLLDNLFNCLNNKKWKTGRFKLQLRDYANYEAAYLYLCEFLKKNISIQDSFKTIILNEFKTILSQKRNILSYFVAEENGEIVYLPPKTMEIFRRGAIPYYKKEMVSSSIKLPDTIKALLTNYGLEIIEDKVKYKYIIENPQQFQCQYDNLELQEPEASLTEISNNSFQDALSGLPVVAKVFTNLIKGESLWNDIIYQSRESSKSSRSLN